MWENNYRIFRMDGYYHVINCNGVWVNIVNEERLVEWLADRVGGLCLT